MGRIVLFFLILIPAFARAEIILNIRGGYLYSRVEHASTASTFSILSESGSNAEAELSLGLKSFDIIGSYTVNQENFKAPSTKTLTNKSVQSKSYMGGIRWKTSFLWISAEGEMRDTLYLSSSDLSAYTLKYQPILMAKLAFKLFSWGPGYMVTLEGEGGLPTASNKTSSGEKIQHSYVLDAMARLEFGSNIRFGVYGGGGAEQYKVNSTSYYRMEVVGGVTLTIGGFRSGGSSGSRSGSGGQSARYPL